MAGITQGFVTGALTVCGLTVLTTTQFQSTHTKIHTEIEKTRNVYELRNEPVNHVSNIRTFYTSNVNEGVKDIWNEEVIRAVNWWYDLKVGDKLVGYITGSFK